LQWADSAALRWIQHFKIAEHVPKEGAISYPGLAAAASVPESQLKRVLRFALLNGFFSESSPGHVSHSAMSHLLATSPQLQDFVNHALEFSYPVSVKMVEMTEKYKGRDEKNETAFNVAFNTPLPMFGWLKGEPEHAARFGRLMGAMKSAPSYDVQHLVNGYDWPVWGKGKVVDVGGSAGHASIAIAQKHQDLTFVVQDLGYVVDQSKDLLPQEVKSRVEFMPHDFFSPQPVKDADVYLLRQILHDWPDDSAIAILKNLVFSLKDGARILVMDQVVPAPGALPTVQEKVARTIDLVVMSHFNGKQRDIDDWKSIFAAVDEKLSIRSVSLHPGSVLSVIELGLDDVPKPNGIVNGVEEKVEEAPWIGGSMDAAPAAECTIKDVPHTNGHSDEAGVRVPKEEVHVDVATETGDSTAAPKVANGVPESTEVVESNGLAAVETTALEGEKPMALRSTEDIAISSEISTA